MYSYFISSLWCFESWYMKLISHGYQIVTCFIHTYQLSLKYFANLQKYPKLSIFRVLEHVSYTQPKALTNEMIVIIHRMTSLQHIFSSFMNLFPLLLKKNRKCQESGDFQTVRSVLFLITQNLIHIHPLFIAFN